MKSSADQNRTETNMNTASIPTPPKGGELPAGLSSAQVQRGIIARWSDKSPDPGWTDRDGLPLPSEMLVIGYCIVLRRWKDSRPEYKTEQPLPNPEDLNALIPMSEWDIGMDGQPSKPWKYCYVAYLVNLKNGTLYTFAHDTFGAMRCYALLEEQIAVMRMIRGAHVWPIVRLEKRPMKTRGGTLITMRPHLEPIDWREPKGPGSGSPLMAPAPQISGPATPEAATPETSAPTQPAAAPASSPNVVLDNTKPVKPVTVGELIADELPPWA
jgi:hypothetical protein